MMLSGDCGDVCCGGLGFFACGDGGESDDGVIFVDVAVATLYLWWFGETFR